MRGKSLRNKTEKGNQLRADRKDRERGKRQSLNFLLIPPPFQLCSAICQDFPPPLPDLSRLCCLSLSLYSLNAAIAAAEEERRQQQWVFFSLFLSQVMSDGLLLTLIRQAKDLVSLSWIAESGTKQWFKILRPFHSSIRFHRRRRLPKGISHKIRKTGSLQTDRSRH